jgi:hypothetical protein
MSISLTGSLQTCKVNTGWANKVESDRFLNPYLVVCPAFNGQDNYGRFVCPDSYYAKAPGCNSALDRVAVENFLRPQYAEFVTLDASGIQGSDVMSTFDSAISTRALADLQKVTGNAGYQYLAQNKISCPAVPYNDAQAQINKMLREADMKKATMEAYMNQRNSGMY